MPSKKKSPKKPPATPATAKSASSKPRAPKSAKPVETCPFDHDVERAVDCPYEKSCPWHVRESAEKCFCSVGETPEMQMRKQIASRLPKE
jgi:hypothetical protein